MAKSQNRKSSKSAATSAIRFVFPAARPSAGSALASYTAAWLQLSGLDSGATLPSKVAREIMGDTAYGYHTRKGNFEKTSDGVKLTEQGFEHFGNVTPNRAIRPDPEMMKAYILTMETGKVSEMVKNEKLIKAIGK